MVQAAAVTTQEPLRMERSFSTRSHHNKKAYMLVGAALLTLGVVVVAAWLNVPSFPPQRQEGLRSLASFADRTSSSYRTSHSSNNHNNNNDDDSKSSSNNDDDSSSSNNDDDSASSSDDSTSTSQRPSTDDDTVSSLISASITVRDEINASSYQTTSNTNVTSFAANSTTTAGNATKTTTPTKGNHTASSSSKQKSSSSSTPLQLPPEPDQPSWWPLGISGGLVIVAILACLVTCVCRQRALKRSSYQPIPHSTTLVV